MIRVILLVALFGVVVPQYSRKLLISSVEEDGVDHFQFVEVDTMQFSIGDLPFVAMALFEDHLNISGWNVLSVLTSAEFPDMYQAYWAGYLETNATRDSTVAHWKNTVDGLCPLPLSKDCVKLQFYLSENLKYTIKQASSKKCCDPFWRQIFLQMWQLRGIVDAYNNVFVENSTLLTQSYLEQLSNDVLGIYLLQLSGDLWEIIKALSLDQLRKSINRFGVPHVAPPTCSALIKLTDDNVYMSHVTWSPYTSMVRVLKHYNFPWTFKEKERTRIPGHAISFSSYPSVISSVDDFYVTSKQLAVMETTIGNSNDSLWAIVRDGVRSSVLEPFRVMAANRLANSGKEWVSYFQKENSGTYNNQWMVFDAKLYKPKEGSLMSGLLTVAEQLPGIVVSDDVTNVLQKQGYWPSYNLAYFPQIYNLSGMQEQRARYGDWFDYYKTARAKIFQRDQGTVKDMASMHRLMRYNNFKKDELSKCNCKPPYTAENAISARNDLNDPNGTYPIPSFEYRIHGGTDVKIVDYALIHTMNMVATSGPTYDDLPPFQWSKLPVPVPRPHMHPDKFMFKPMITSFPDYNGDRLKTPMLRPVFPVAAKPTME